MTDENVLEQINKLITEKVDAALKPVLEKLDALTPKSDEKTEEQTEKTDALDLAKQTLRTKLDGFIPAEKLDAMNLIEMSQTLAKLQAALTAPSSAGILNPVGGSTDKTDAIKKAFDKKKIGEVVFE